MLVLFRSVPSRNPGAAAGRAEGKSRRPASTSTEVTALLAPDSDQRRRANRPLAMTKATDVAASAAKASLTDADLERIREFTREPVLLEGEGLDALAPGTARRRAADAAL